MKREKTTRMCTRKRHVLVPNSYSESPPPLSEILYPPLVQLVILFRVNTWNNRSDLINVVETITLRGLPFSTYAPRGGWVGSCQIACQNAYVLNGRPLNVCDANNVTNKSIIM